MSELVERIIAIRDRLKPLTRAGEDFIWRPAKEAVEVLADAANALTASCATDGSTGPGIPQNPSVDAGLLEALKEARDLFGSIQTISGANNKEAATDLIYKRAAEGLAAIARAESSQGVDASLVEDLGAGTGSPTTSARLAHHQRRCGLMGHVLAAAFDVATVLFAIFALAVGVAMLLGASIALFERTATAILHAARPCPTSGAPEGQQTGTANDQS